MPRNHPLLLVLALALPAALRAQEVVDVGRPARTDLAIRVFALSGALRITTWERDSVHVRGRVDRSAGQFFLGGTREALKLGIEMPKGTEPTGTADLEIQIPARSRLWVKTAAAEVEITAGGGSVDVFGESGRVRVDGRADNVRVETIDGNVELALVAASGQVRTASGTIVVRGVVTDLQATTISGPLLVGMEGAVERVALETVASEIAFKGDITPEGRLQAETHDGDVELRLPAHLGASYHLVSFAGQLTNELVPPAALRPGAHKGEWSFTMGDGRATVDVRTFKGRLTLKLRGEPPH